MKIAQRVILHADLNSFFATAEQQANPALRGKPVGVVKGLGRTCIIAASVEAKKYGVGTGSRVYDAKKLCPQIILVPADFNKYEDISGRFIKICSTYSPLCEVFSLDECFVDVTETEQFWGNVFNIALDIKKRLKEEIGDYMTCSIGISHNRFLAKLASSRIKPDGLFWITEDNMIEVLDKSKLMDVCGLGWGLYRHLVSLGIDSFTKLRARSLDFLTANFGPYWSYHLYNICRGIDNSSVSPYTNLKEQKSVGRTYTTHRVLNSWDEIYKVSRNLCEETAQKARVMGLCGRHVGFFLRTSPRQWSHEKLDNEVRSWYGHMTLKRYIDSGSELFNICKQISKSWKVKDVIFFGVNLGMLTAKNYQSLPLFEEDKKHARLTFSIDGINERFGNYTVFPGQLLGMPIVMPEVTGFFGDRKYQIAKMGLGD